MVRKREGVDPTTDRDGSRRATIKDVSRVAGVSIKTVSRVLNNERYVKIATRERIEQAMAALHFSPSIAARALGGGRTFQIALICDNPSPYYVYEVQKGLRARCREDHVNMIAQPYDREADDIMAEIVTLIDQVQPDGLILTPPISDDQAVLDMLLDRGMPFVRISPNMPGGVSPSVGIDNEQAAFDIVSHLIALGHRSIGMIVGHPDYAASGQRMSGYLRALQTAGLSIDLNMIQQGQFDFASGERATAALLAMAKRPTAIFASSDDMAAGALAQAHEQKVRVPDELSIVGFDNTSLAEVVWPRLTTVSQPTREMAYAAAELLLAGRSTVEHRTLEHRVVVRNSAGPPSA